MFCRNCWTNLPDGAQVCTKCGASLDKDNIESTKATNDSPGAKTTKPVEHKIVNANPASDQKRSSPLFKLFIIIIIPVAAYVIYMKSVGKDPFLREPVYIDIYEGQEEARPLDDTALIGDGGEVAARELALDEPAFSDEIVTSSDEAVKGIVALLKEGNYEIAAIKLDEVVEGAPDKRGYLASHFASAGVREFENENFDIAEMLLSEAVSLEKNPKHTGWIALSRLKLGDIDGALAVMEEMAGDPASEMLLFSLYTTLGDSHYQGGMVDDAAIYYKKALHLSPNDKYLLSVMKRLSRELSAEEDFNVKEGEHFIVKFESGENAVTGHVIGLLLEEAYIKIGSDMGYYPDDMIGAVLYGDKQFSDITRSPSWAGALYDGRIKLPAGGITERTALLESVLFHEYTHALVHRIALGKAPLWLNEGLAQYEENKRTDKYEALLRQFAASGNLSLRSLEGSFMGMSTSEAKVAYMLSLSAVEYLMTEYGAFSVKSILEGLGSGLSLDDAVYDALYMSYSDLNEAWVLSIKR